MVKSDKITEDVNAFMIAVAGIYPEGTNVAFYPVNTEEKIDPKDLPNCMRVYQQYAENLHV